jgi:hypothetical protein
MTSEGQHAGQPAESTSGGQAGSARGANPPASPLDEPFGTDGFPPDADGQGLASPPPSAASYPVSYAPPPQSTPNGGSPFVVPTVFGQPGDRQPLDGPPFAAAGPRRARVRRGQSVCPARRAAPLPRCRPRAPPLWGRRRPRRRLGWWPARRLRGLRARLAHPGPGQPGSERLTRPRRTAGSAAPAVGSHRVGRSLRRRPRSRRRGPGSTRL